MGGYLSAPASKIGEKRTFGDSYTVEELMKYGFRPDDRRGKAGRAPGAGRMNVRADPLNQGWYGNKRSFGYNESMEESTQQAVDGLNNIEKMITST